MAAADVRGIPRIVTAHGNHLADLRAAAGGFRASTRAFLLNRLTTSVIQRVDAVISVNPDWTANLPLRPRRFLYIPNIVDHRFYDLPREPEPGLVLFAGGARAIKGWPLLAAAWPFVRHAVPEARLRLVGWPTDERPGGRSVHEDSVSVEGWLSTSDLAARMACASVLVIPSQFEVAPLVLAEAWALGLPVVATAVGGLRALAQGAAALVPPRDPETLAEGIIRALARGDEIDGLVDEGRRRAEAHRAEAVARAHLALYTELVEQAAR